MKIRRYTDQPSAYAVSRMLDALDRQAAAQCAREKRLAAYWASAWASAIWEGEGDKSDKRCEIERRALGRARLCRSREIASAVMSKPALPS